MTILLVTVQFGSVPTNLVVAIESGSLSPVLEKGITIAFPDYQGPNSAFIAGQLEGRLMLDATRAVLQYAPFGLKNPKIGIWVRADFL